MERFGLWLLFAIYLLIILLNGYNFDDKNFLKIEYAYSDLKIKSGDDPEWRKVDYNDTAWNWNLPLQAKENIWWIRAKVKIIDSLAPNKIYGVRISTSGVHEAYWDGLFLGTNGTFDNEDKIQSTSKYWEYYAIPESNSDTGDHQISLRLLSKDMSKVQYPKILVDDYISLAREPLILSTFIHFIGGIYLGIALYFLVQFVSSNNEKSLLVFSVLCFCFLLLLIFEYVKFYYQFSISFQSFRIEVIQYTTLLIALLIPLHTLFYFKFPRKVFVLILASVSFLAMIILFFGYGYDKRAFYLMMVALTISTALGVWANYKSIKNSKRVIFGLICISSSLFYYYDLLLFVGFVIYASIICADHLLQALRIKRRFHVSLLRAKRLEVELLKKKIQPHFLMNTLTSLIDIIEEDPVQAKYFIHSLAHLFDILNDISSEESIPIHKEIDLCKSHLEIMSHRKDIAYSLITKNIQGQDKIPPAILLTAIENGISHNKPINNRIEFIIEYSETKIKKIYKVFASGIINRIKNKTEDGIGNQYIKARLKEFYHDKNWEFCSEENENGWLTEISISKT